MTDYAPLSQLPVVTWRGCAGCNGTLLLDERQNNQARSADGTGAYLLCRACQETADAEEARKPVVPHARCVHRLYQSGPFSDLFIVKVESADYTVTLADGEHLVRRPARITVGVLGLGGVEPERAREILGRCWPAGVWRDGLVYSRAELVMKGF
jgi:hypothetical protein